jgi:hypothetical protein
MRRVTLMLAAVAMMVSLFAVVAYAAEIQGTDNSENLLESDRNDKIAGHRGDDKIWAKQYSNDTDKVKGNRNDDWIYVDDADTRDTANGGKGQDHCYGTVQLPPLASDKFVECEWINDAPVDD